jgi:hypothetical protein
MGRMDLSLYHAEISAVAGSPGRDHTAPQLLISLWLYAYSQGIFKPQATIETIRFDPVLVDHQERFSSQLPVPEKGLSKVQGSLNSLGGFQIAFPSGA